MPPRRVQGVVGPEISDIGTISLARVVFELERRAKLGLVVQLGERADVREPPNSKGNAIKSCDAVFYWSHLRVCVKDFECLTKI